MIPYIDKSLLEHLQKTFPNKLPEKFTTPEEMGYLIGQQKVISYLLHQSIVQNSRILQGTS